jgi:hypothetical protein
VTHRITNGVLVNGRVQELKQRGSKLERIDKRIPPSGHDDLGIRRGGAESVENVRKVAADLRIRIEPGKMEEKIGGTVLTNCSSSSAAPVVEGLYLQFRSRT